MEKKCNIKFQNFPRGVLLEIPLIESPVHYLPFPKLPLLNANHVWQNHLPSLSFAFPSSYKKGNLAFQIYNFM